MSLSAVLLILAAIAVAEAVIAFQGAGGDDALAMMGAILLIAAVLVLLDLTTAAVVAGNPSVG